MQTNTLVAGGIVSMATSLAGMAAAFLLHIILSRALGIQGYGRYVVIIAWAMLLAIPVRLGLDDAALRIASIYRSDGRAADLKGFARFSLGAIFCAWALVAVAAFAFSLTMRSRLFSADLPALLMIVLPVAGMGYLSALFRVDGKIFASQSYLGLWRPLLLILLVLVVWEPGQQLGSPMAIWLTATSLWALFFLMLVSRLLNSAERHVIANFAERAEWISASLVFLPMALGREALNQIDLLMLGTLADDRAAALFSAAWRLASLIPFGLVAMTVVSAAPIAAAHHRGDHVELTRIARHAARIAFAIALAIAIALMIGGRWILGWFGPPFGASYPLLLVMLAGGLGNAFTGVAGYFLLMTGRQKVALWFVMSALTLELLLDLLLIPQFGALGAALAWSLVTVGWNLALAFWLWRKTGIRSLAIG